MEINTKKEINLMLNPEEIKNQKIRVKPDLITLDMVIAFLYKDSVLRTRKALNNIYKLFTSLDETLFMDNPDITDRIWIIKKTIYARLVDGITTENSYVMQYCIDDLECTERIKELIEDIPNKKITHEESKRLLKKIDDILEYGYIGKVKTVFEELMDRYNDEDFKSYKSIQDDLYQLATSVINIKRSASSLGSDQTFSLYGETFDNTLEESLQKLKDKNRIFLTGIQRLNTLLSPGYMSKRLYTYLAFPGKGKSTILLKSALDIKKYNKGIETKDPDKRPAVLFLTLENDISETVERIYNMTVDSDDIRNLTPKQLKKKLKNEGQLVLTDDNNIDIIIKEYKNRELDTNDLYSIINDLSDEGIEVIALILDYMKRIRPAERAKDEKTELKNISNELKELAKFFDIPVITAQQLNRSGASVVDAAIQANKDDVTRLVGRDSIAGAWEILENSDWTCIINPETKIDTGELFMTFKLLKRRYRSIEPTDKLRRLDYFNQPFEVNSEIRLIDDFGLDKPLALESLATSFQAVDDKKGTQNAIQRPKTNEKKKKSIIDDEILDFEPFNSNQSSNF